MQRVKIDIFLNTQKARELSPSARKHSLRFPDIPPVHGKGMNHDSIHSALQGRVGYGMFNYKISVMDRPQRRKEHSMFDNIGKKIKVVASIYCWIGIIASIILGILVISEGEDLIGWVVIVAGSLFSWISSFALYGFGQLIDNSDIQTDIMRQEQNDRKKHEERQAETVPDSVHEVAPRPVVPPAPVKSNMPASLQETVPEPQSDKPRASDPAVIPISLDSDHERCPKCSTVQRSGRIRCWGCGVTFIRESESKE